MARSAVRRDVAPAETVDRSQTLVRTLLAILHVVCPILFFTNLTRNPYFSQIALLNIGISVCGLIWAVSAVIRGEWKLPRIPVTVPLAAFLACAAVSSALSWFQHDMVRAGLSFEMTRVWVFTLINSAVVLYLPGLYSSPIGENPKKISIWSDISLVLLWCLMWLPVHQMKSPDPSQLIWDTYGGFLWVLAILYAYLRARDGNALSYFHLIFSVCLVAGIYGIAQYWGRDIIWTSPIQPYGGRPVSSFGNPNFLSSYLMMACPLAIVLAVRAEGSQRWGYAVVAAVAGLGILSTLTRSTYVGLVAALLVTGASLFRKGDFKLGRPALFALAGFLGLVLLFPSTPVSSVQSPLARFTEIFDAMKTGQSYGPWHQRILIWSSAWEMLKGGHQLFGRGWGSFELFFPFFQGKFLLVENLAQWRTHANNAHNVLLEVWAQTGIMGTAASLWILTTMLVGGWTITRRSSAGAGRLAAAALLGGTAGMFVDNFFGNVSLFFAVPAFLFWWNVGALFNEGASRSWVGGRLSDGLGRPAMVVVASLFIAAGSYYVVRWKQEVWYFQGFKEARIGDLQASVRSLETAIRWFPGEVNTNYELGNSLARVARGLQQKNLAEETARADERALAAYRLALNANPGYDEIHFNEGVTLAQLGKIDDAISKIEMALFINPILREAYGPLGTLYLKKGEFAKAADLYRRASQTFKDDKDFANNLGYALTQLGKNDEAFDAYRRAVVIDPTFERAWTNLSAAAQLTGRKDPILEVPELIDSMGKYIEKKDFGPALARARRVVELLPDSADAHLSTGNLLFYANQLDEAIKEMEKALELKPDLAAAHANLGTLHAFRRDLPKARLHLSRAIELNPSDDASRRALDALK